MVDILTKSFPAKNAGRFKVRFENGMLIPDEQLNLLSGQTYWVILQPTAELDQPAPVDALAQIVALATPLGPADLARNFDSYTGRVLPDEPAT